MEHYDDSASHADKVRYICSMLREVRNPTSATEDNISAHAIELLLRKFISTRDTSILDAIDSIRVEGGFANTVCGGFYSEIAATHEFKERYVLSRVHLPAIERCVGISFSTEDLRD
jgi:hypothetical protein